MSRSKIFLESEGDDWFDRNRDSVRCKSRYYETDTVKRVLEAYSDKISTILEIGCGNGAKLYEFCNFFGATEFSIDPSRGAVSDVNKKYGSVDLVVSTA